MLEEIARKELLCVFTTLHKKTNLDGAPRLCGEAAMNRNEKSYTCETRIYYTV